MLVHAAIIKTRLEEIVFLYVGGQDISRNFLPDEVIQPLVTAYVTLPKENSRTMPRCQPMYRGSTGRPALDIPRETLKLYLSYGFSLKKIANMFGTSRKTISRPIKSYNLREEVPKYDDLSDEALVARGRVCLT